MVCDMIWGQIKGKFMTLPPQKFREIVLQILFSSDFDKSQTEDAAMMLMAELKVSKKNVLLAHEKVLLIFEKLAEIDEKISTYSTDYTFDRISNVEKAVLRLGVYELMNDPSIPEVVVISEAIRLTRKFATPESSNFVNAILDKVYKNANSLSLQA